MQSLAVIDCRESAKRVASDHRGMHPLAARHDPMIVLIRRRIA